MKTALAIVALNALSENEEKPSERKRAATKISREKQRTCERKKERIQNNQIEEKREICKRTYKNLKAQNIRKQAPNNDIYLFQILNVE